MDACALYLCSTTYIQWVLQTIHVHRQGRQDMENVHMKRELYAEYTVMNCSNVLYTNWCIKRLVCGCTCASPGWPWAGRVP